ncbi:exosome complex component RRP43 [Olea europaea var. sylvestris]|uniref:exosome complex component RRP43 n=1 Tax=Olea europaea var. sylvestris TaxID=158386 RepID=UPI000C1D1152|nr:exosome complex component RRP43 [Olea europaea var. sylvestris]XP_022856922.1 exosome complex component RRP43 [Olea europaea var. sylvestris]
MSTTNGSNDLSSEMEVDAFRRLFPLRFYERHLLESIRPDGRPLGRARDTTIALGAVASANGSALAKIGCTTMLAAVKLEVMTPKLESPDEGCIAIDFHMPPICSPLVRPGRPAEAAPVITKQLTDIILSSGMIDLKELSLVSGKAAWLAYLDIYCLDADGSLFDAALLSAVAAFSHLQIPVVSLNDNGRIVLISEENSGAMWEKEPVNKEKRKLKLDTLPFSLTCALHKNYILADPSAEEESIMETYLTVVLDSSLQLVSLNKPGGPGLAQTSAIQDCVALTIKRVKELQKILNEAISDMEVD